jgi:hypothetical protein
MAKFICLQAGHQNAKNNCDPILAKGTGAPGEAEFTVRIRDRVKDILLSKKNLDGTQAFMVQLVDATFNCDPKADDNDYALFLAIHYDADIYGKGGGFLDFPEPSTDGVTQESQRIVREMEAEYFRHSGITNVPGRRNANTKFYYMWKFLSFKTPCVIIECGVGKDEHDSVILADTDRVANAIVRGICRALNVPFDASTPSASVSPSQSPSPSLSTSPSQSPSPSPSPSQPWESSSNSASRSASNSFSPSPSPEIPVDPAEKIRMMRAVVFSSWSIWFWSPNYWKNKLQKLKIILDE